MEILAFKLFLVGFVAPVAIMLAILLVARRLRQRQEHRSRRVSSNDRATPSDRRPSYFY